VCLLDLFVTQLVLNLSFLVIMTRCDNSNDVDDDDDDGDLRDEIIYIRLVNRDGRLSDPAIRIRPVFH